MSIIGYDYSSARLGFIRDLTDDHLRAECERRGYVPWFSAAVDDLRARLESAVAGGKAAMAERDAVVERARCASARCIELERERDEWKRRAEAAEAEAEQWKRQAMTPPGGTQPHVRNIESGAFADWSNEPALECGPSIAAKPPQSEPHAHLDEDLLCEDA